MSLVIIITAIQTTYTCVPSVLLSAVICLLLYFEVSKASNMGQDQTAPWSSLTWVHTVYMQVNVNLLLKMKNCR